MPDAWQYYSMQLEKFHARDHKATGLCPFHDDHNPSLEVKLHSGSFRCYSCGANGRGIVDFQMQRYGQDFVTAAKTLGAWG